MASLRQWIGRRLRPSTWNGWPEKAYQQASYRNRLLAVQEHLAAALDHVPSGVVRILSICAGDGRDIIDVLFSHGRRDDTLAWLIEQDPHSVAVGTRHAASAASKNMVRFVLGDASACSTYQGLIPADIVLFCGVWGHVPSMERISVVRTLTAMCKSGGKVIWTRGIGKGIARFHQIDSHFVEPVWERVSFTITPDKSWAIVTHRYGANPSELVSSGHFFHFRTGAGTR